MESFIASVFSDRDTYSFISPTNKWMVWIRPSPTSPCVIILNVFLLTGDTKQTSAYKSYESTLTSNDLNEHVHFLWFS
jgi:hypothetical protein